MRIGSKLVAAVAWVIVGASTTAAPGAADVERVRPVPLGGALADQSGDRSFGVYVPRFGGALSVKTTAGTVERLTGPDGRPRTNGGEVGENQQGWYTFKVAGPNAPYKVDTTFVQVGQSTRTPWNFYYWPTKADAIHEPWVGGNGRVDTMQVANDDILVATPGSWIAPGQDIVRAGPNGLLETLPAPGDTSTWFPNQYDDLTFRGADGTLYQTPSPMLKYDQLFNSSARSWEAANSQNQDIQRWPGHCLGGAVASILLNEPVPAPGTGMTQDELKALWAELGENHYNHRIGDFANEIPAGPPRPGLDPCDHFVPCVHAMLESHIRGRKQAILCNLRAFPPNGKDNEVWNHGVGKYTAKYHAVPGKGERTVRLEVELLGNSGSNLNNNDNKPRIVKYEYILTYGLNGQVDEANPNASDWIAVGGEAMFAPLNLLEVVESRWAGHNPMVTESNVRALDSANGGGGISLFGPKFTGAAPTFRPVNAYEYGRVDGGGSRAPIFAFGRSSRVTSGGDGVAPTAPTPRRGGLLRIFAGGR